MKSLKALDPSRPTREADMLTATNNGLFRVSVRDTGPGISAADQAKLFQEFQQADNAIAHPEYPRFQITVS
jgi:signal transduction histidine kinase